MLALYDMLLEQKRTALVILNRAIVLSQLNQTSMALQEIWRIENIEHLINTNTYSVLYRENYISNVLMNTTRANSCNSHYHLLPHKRRRNLFQTKLEALAKTKMN
jgi:predicted RNA polymerase sigma factor